MKESNADVFGRYGSRRTGVSVILLAAFFFGGICQCFGQNVALPESETAISSPIPITYIPPPVPAGKQKNAAVLGRLAITGFGAIPFALFYTNFVFDAVRFVGNGFDVQYAPWPFKTQYSAEVTAGETFLRLGVAFGLGAAIGVLDAIIPRKQ